MTNVFAIIVTYNGAKWISKCLQSVADSTIPVKILVVDNGSDDNTRQKIKEDFPAAELIVSDLNIGFGQANNMGIKKAYADGASHFFLLNQDAWIEQDTIEKLVAQQQKNKEYGVLSPLHLNGQGMALDFEFSTCIVPSKCPGLYSDFCL